MKLISDAAAAIRTAVGTAIRGGSESLQKMLTRLPELQQEREQVLRAPATLQSIQAAYERDIRAVADEVPRHAKRHYDKHHATAGGSFFDQTRGLSILGIPPNAPDGKSPAPTLESGRGQASLAVLTYVLRDQLIAALPKFVAEVHSDLPGAISTEQRAKKLAALDEKISNLESEISDVQDAFTEARRLVQ
jgi:hypothetical protein